MRIQAISKSFSDGSKVKNAQHCYTKYFQFDAMILARHQLTISNESASAILLPQLCVYCARFQTNRNSFHQTYEKLFIKMYPEVDVSGMEVLDDHSIH